MREPHYEERPEPSLKMSILLAAAMVVAVVVAWQQYRAYRARIAEAAHEAPAFIQTESESSDPSSLPRPVSEEAEIAAPTLYTRDADRHMNPTPPPPPEDVEAFFAAQKAQVDALRANRDSSTDPGEATMTKEQIDRMAEQKVIAW